MGRSVGAGAAWILAGALVLTAASPCGGATTDSAAAAPVAADSAAAADSVATTHSTAAAPAGESARGSRTVAVDLPLLDIPFNGENGGSFPSVSQALGITCGVTRGVHHSLVNLWHPGIADRSPRALAANRRLGGLCASLLVFDALSPFSGWAHEEGHRAILSLRGISSRNEIYRNPFAGMVSVSHVRDEDLAWLKDRHPADMVRLAEMGGEVQLESVLRMRKANFFSGRASTCDLLDWWLRLGSLTWYVWYCGEDDANRLIEEETLKENADVSRRDIVGGDYLSWVYDLFRPDEPYLAGVRGRPHPSGVGVDRYIQPSELTGEERRYLRRQGRLMLLNFLSPQLFGFDRFGGADPATGGDRWWNVAVTHQLTTFGTATGLHLLCRRGGTNLAFTLNNYFSRYRYWPGLSVELAEVPVRVAGSALLVSASGSAWLQPAGQRFAATKARGGGGMILGVACPLAERLAWRIECDGKSEGWVAGNVYLDPAWQARMGLRWRLP